MAALVVLLLAYGYCAALTLLLIQSWWGTYVLYRSFPAREAWLMVRLSRHTHLLYRQTIPCLVSLAIIAGLVITYGSRMAAPVAATFVAMSVQAVFLLLKSIQPPAGVFLSCSSPYAADLLVQIDIALSPLRCIALLDPKKMHFMQRNAIADNIRSRNPKLWKSIVHQLVDMAPLVILDTRGDSRAVMQEAFIVLTPRRARKTVFILDDDRSAGALQVHGIDPLAHALTCVTEDELIPFLLEWRSFLPARFASSEWETDAPMAESWDNLPSILVVGLPAGFDSENVVRYALDSGKELLLLITPLTDIQRDDAKWTLDYSWAFVHEPRLAIMIFEKSARAFIRIDFLGEVAGVMQRYHARALQPPLTFAQANAPEPVWSAVCEFLEELRRHAKQRDLEVRHVKR